MWRTDSRSVTKGGRDSIPVIGGRGPACVAEALRLSAITVQRVGEDIVVRGRIGR